MFPHPVRTERETWLYYHGAEGVHGGRWWRHRSALFRARLRRDGFGSANASYQGGELVTVPVRFRGDSLTLNADTSAGGVIRVELLDADAAPLRGFALSDADELNGNDVCLKVTWNGSSDLRTLAGRAVRLRFVMRDWRAGRARTRAAPHCHCLRRNGRRHVSEQSLRPLFETNASLGDAGALQRCRH